MCHIGRIGVPVFDVDLARKTGTVLGGRITTHGLQGVPDRSLTRRHGVQALMDAVLVAPHGVSLCGRPRRFGVGASPQVCHRQIRDLVDWAYDRHGGQTSITAMWSTLRRPGLL
jgi:hypothetical protein